MKNKVTAFLTLATITCALNLTAQDAAPLPAEKRVAFRTTGGYYITAENGGGASVHTDRTELGPWETFAMVAVSPGVFAFRTETGHYLSDMAAETQRGGKQTRTALAASRKNINAATQFKLMIVNAEGPVVALVTTAGKYVTAENNGGIKARGTRAMSTDRTEIGAWETFQLIDVDRQSK